MARFINSAALLRRWCKRAFLPSTGGPAPYTPVASNLLLETGDVLLAETGDALLLES